MSGSKLMRAIRVSEFGGPSVLKICSNVKIPKPGPKQVLVRVHACGVNPVETYIRSGNFANLPQLPYTPGSDVSGVVQAVGEGVSAFKAGDRVFSSYTVTGGYAEYIVAADDSIYKLPDNLDFNQGASMGIPYFSAYRALVHKAKAKPGETVLIHGASGGVGVPACQLSRALGLTVLGTAGTPEGLKLVLNNGAHLAFNHREDGYTDKIMKATGGKGVDVIVEMISNVNLAKDLKMLAYGGRVVLIGSRGPIEIDPGEIMLKESSVMGLVIFFAKPEELSESAAMFISGMEAGWLKPIVGRQYPLEEASKAHHDIIESRGASGKIILTMK